MAFLSGPGLGGENLQAHNHANASGTSAKLTAASINTTMNKYGYSFSITKISPKLAAPYRADLRASRNGHVQPQTDQTEGRKRKKEREQRVQRVKRKGRIFIRPELENKIVHRNAASRTP